MTPRHAKETELSSGSTTTDAAAPEFSIIAGNPTPAELAAVTAVLTTMIDEIEENGRAHNGAHQSAWQRSQRPIRLPLLPGYGSWRGFSGK